MFDRFAVLAAVALTLASPVAAFAADRMYSYDPANPEAKRLTGRGLTFIFERSMMRTRAKRVMATAVSAQAWLKPAGDKVLGTGGRVALGGEPIEGDLYEVDATRGQGRVFVRAWCPGSTKLWMAIPRFGYSQPLSVVAVGDDPKVKDGFRVCSRMEFGFRGEWKLPGRGAPDPMDDPLDGAGLQGAGF